MIESICLKKVATYDSIGIEMTDLRKINFIYGVNGSGKTTLTKFLFNPLEPTYSNCTFDWKNRIEIKKLVYNKDFRERNFGKGGIDGVFTLPCNW